MLAFSGDHGVLTTPEYLLELGQTAHRVTGEEVAALREVIAEAVGAGGTAEETAKRVSEALRGVHFVADARPRSEVVQGPPADSFVVLFRNNFREDRAAGGLARLGVYRRWTEGTLLRFGTGTSHGSPYWYDRHVPLIFLGSGIQPGQSDEPVRTVDVAPTLAQLAGIPAPSDLDGRPLLP